MTSSNFEINLWMNHMSQTKSDWITCKQDISREKNGRISFQPLPFSISFIVAYNQWMEENGGVIINIIADMWKGFPTMR